MSTTRKNSWQSNWQLSKLQTFLGIIKADICRHRMADRTPTFLTEEDEEPMATEPIYLSSDENEYSTSNTTPTHQIECIYPDSINQLMASQLEQRSNMGAGAIVYPPTPNTSIISDDEDPMNPTPIIGNPEKYTPQIPPRRNHPMQLCQHVQPITDTPQSPTRENRGQSDDSYPDNIPLHNPPPNIIAVTDELNNLTLHPHAQRNEWVTGCLVCSKSYDQVIEETVADYLDQTSQPSETVRERQIKRNAFIDGVQSGIFTFIPPEVSAPERRRGLSVLIFGCILSIFIWIVLMVSLWDLILCFRSSVLGGVGLLAALGQRERFCVEWFGFPHVSYVG